MLEAIYAPLLSAHSLFRWVILATALWAIFTAFRGFKQDKAFSPVGRKAGLFYVTALDLQLVFGLLLYGISPIVQAFLQNPKLSMKIHDIRSIAVEHLSIMIVALVLAHIGSAKSKRGRTDRLKYKHALIWYSASFVVILAGIPWWRPLIRAFN